jgi:hypothetical protein
MQSMSATLAMFAAVAFVVVLLILHVIRADMAPSWHMISEYAEGRSVWIMGLAFFALATSFIALAAAFLPTTRGILGHLALIMLVVAGVGAAIGGLFPVDPAGTPPDQFSTAGKLHGVGFMLGVPGTLLGVTLLSISLWRRPEWQSAHAMLGITVAAVWITMIVFGVSMATLMGRGATGPEFVIGWQNRALVLSWVTWVFMVAWRLQVPSQN